jgi:general secretion pathway protein K
MMMRNSAPGHDASPRDGFIIIAVLWILLALATMASIYALYVSNSALALAVMDDGLQSDLLVSTSLELTAYRMAAPGKDTGPTPKPSGATAKQAQARPTRGTFGFGMGRANVTVEFNSEAARIDLNAAPMFMLAGLFAALGASDLDAENYANRVIGWRTAPRPNAQASEEALYRAAGLRHLPRGAPFAHVNELWLVQGLPPAMVARAMSFVTIYSGRPDINIFDARPEVIATLPGMTPARLQNFLAQRDTATPDPEALPRLLGADQAGATVEGSDAIRVTVRIAFANGRQTTSEVIIYLGADDEPYRVLSWRNDIDAEPVQSGTATGLR